MRVLLINQAFAGVGEAGGTRHLELGQRLAVRGDKLTVVASQVHYLTGERRHGSRYRLYAKEQTAGVTVLRVYTPAVHHRGFGWRVFGFVVFSLGAAVTGLVSGKTDLVMGTSPSLFQAVAAWAVARLRRRPFLLEIRDLWPEFAIEMGVLTNPGLRWAARWLERFLYRHADRLLVNSPAYVDHLVAKGAAPAKISFIANGVDVGMFDPAAAGAATRAAHALGAAFVVVYAGAHGAANDLDTLLRAAERLRDDDGIKFLLAGDGKERPRLQAEAARRGLDNVVFAGPIPKEKMPDVLAAADACVATLRDIPMFATTYPNKVFDYMAAGRPVVFAIDGVIREVVEVAGAGIFVPPGDDGALEEAILALAGDRERARAMGAAGRRHAVAHFNRDTQAAQFRALVHAVAAGRTPEPDAT